MEILFDLVLGASNNELNATRRSTFFIDDERRRGQFPFALSLSLSGCYFFSY
jgi:hypothetical protein